MCLSVNNCCCCITLDVGTKIISIVSTVLSFIIATVYGTLVALDRQLPVSRLLFYSALAVTTFLQFGFGCLLIYGAFAKRPSHTWPWTVVTWCVSFALIIISVAGMALLSYNLHPETTAEISSVISVYFVYALIQFYFLSVVHSRRQQMALEERTITAQRLTRHRVLPQYYV